MSKGGVMSWESGVNEADCDNLRELALLNLSIPTQPHPSALHLTLTAKMDCVWLPKHTTTCSYPAALTSLPALHFLLLTYQSFKPQLKCYLQE